MDIIIPGRDLFGLTHLVLDVNGTVAAGGQLIGGVREQVLSLQEAGFEVHWITADTRGRQAALDKELGWPAVRLSTDGLQGEAEQKAAFVESLGAEHVVAVGNGSNDKYMFKAAAIGIAVLGSEGLAVDALLEADIVVPNIHIALDLLQDPARLVATLRT
jgi:P-type E1-E2 ATPase